jgi:hypothetical protein
MISRDEVDLLPIEHRWPDLVEPARERRIIPDVDEVARNDYRRSAARGLGSSSEARLVLLIPALPKADLGIAEVEDLLRSGRDPGCSRSRSTSSRGRDGDEERGAQQHHHHRGRRS